MDLKYWLAGHHIFFSPVGPTLNLECRPQHLNNPPTRSKIQISHVEFKVLHDPPAYHFTAFSNSKTFRPLGYFLVPSNTPSFSVWICCSALHIWTYERMSPERRLVLTEKEPSCQSFILSYFLTCSLFCHSHPWMWTKTLSSLVNSIPPLLRILSVIYSCATNTDCMNAWRLFPSTSMKIWSLKELQKQLKTSNHYSPRLLLIRLLSGILLPCMLVLRVSGLNLSSHNLLLGPPYPFPWF